MRIYAVALAMVMALALVGSAQAQEVQKVPAAAARTYLSVLGSAEDSLGLGLEVYPVPMVGIRGSATIPMPGIYGGSVGVLFGRANWPMYGVGRVAVQHYKSTGCVNDICYDGVGERRKLTSLVGVGFRVGIPDSLAENKVPLSNKHLADLLIEVGYGWHTREYYEKVLHYGRPRGLTYTFAVRFRLGG